MAALTRPTEATYAIHEKITVDTTDREDHTFCGVMFPVKCKNTLPVHQITVDSVSVRGGLGPLTVWVSKLNVPSTRGRKRFSMKRRDWIKIYEKEHPPSYRNYVELKLEQKIALKPGQTRAIYVHSSRPGDEAIVYDNKHQHKTHDDPFISIFPGRAHVCETAFGSTPMWGWGNAWRSNREFVGRLSYGVYYKLWNPTTTHLEFGSRFQGLVRTMLGLQRRAASPVSKLPDDCIYYILNMCRWDWVNDSPTMMKLEQQARRQRLALAAAAASRDAQEGGENMVEDGLAQTGQQQQVEEVADDDDDEMDDDYNEEDDDDDNSNEDELLDTDYEEEEEEEEDDDELDSDDEEWNPDYIAGNSFFPYYDDSDEDEAVAEAREREDQRRQWIRSHFARIHVMQALASTRNDVAVEFTTNG